MSSFVSPSRSSAPLIDSTDSPDDGAMGADITTAAERRISMVTPEGGRTAGRNETRGWLRPESLGLTKRIYRQNVKKRSLTFARVTLDSILDGEKTGKEKRRGLSEGGQE